ncbi:MAG: 3,4-dihydroxy-2-butanone-4-phosphate synthase [Gammaproteobacteria bacterium]|nr:3,4-dihydroxy-2-butanone-4-phosphate synthase [Gammaproteobacteria bacterium]
MQFDSIDSLIDTVRAGRMVIVVDDDDSNNEGQLVMAAAAVQPQDINFMARHGRGLICLALSPERCEQLRLPLMVAGGFGGDDNHFTVSIEAARGVTTGISAADRAQTIRTAVAPDAKPADLVQPGHVFPLLAQPGGVLVRAGHSEAGCDLARLAGHECAAVTVGILDETGELADLEAMGRLARTHGLPMGTIKSLIEYRLQHEMTVHRIAECTLPTEFGEFRLLAYAESIGDELHLALVKGDVSPERPTLVRVHIENPLCDLTGNTRADCGWPLRDVLRRLAGEGGVAVILRNKLRRADLVLQMQRWTSDSGSGCEATRESVRSELRVIGLGAQILVDIGVRRMRVLSLPRTFHGISGFGLEVVEHIT